LNGVTSANEKLTHVQFPICRGILFTMNEQTVTKTYRKLNADFTNLLNSFSALSALSSLDLRQVNEAAMLRNALKGLLENLEINSCSIFLVHNDVLVNCAGLDLEDLFLESSITLSPKDASSDTTVCVGEGIMGLAVKLKTLQHCRDCMSDSHFKKLPGRNIGSLISAPIFQIGGEVLGVLNVSHPEPHTFNEWHERFLSVFCHFLGQLLINYRLLNQMDSEIEKRAGQLKQALGEARVAQQSLQLFKTIIESLQEAVSIQSSDGTLIYINPAFEKLFGCTLEDSRKTGVSGCYAPESVEVLVSQMIPSIVRGESWEGELSAIDAKGRSFPVLSLAGAVRDSKGIVLFTFSFIRDISEQRRTEEEKKKLEAQLHQAQKMEAIGQLAGGVAHDFNNIITAITGYAHLLLMKMGKDDPLRRFAEQITASAERAVNVTSSLLAFSRKQTAIPQPVNVNQVIRKVYSLLSRLIGEDILLETCISREELVVMADSSQLEQILMNLATNARDAMKSGGRITISTELVEIEEDFIRSHGYGETGKFACISVKDTGTGMDANVIEKIFEPFFTTKEVGKGTGLGLSIVYGIVKQSNGFLDVCSEPAKGTLFRILLPIINVTAVTDELSTDIPAVIGKGTILLAEDDEEVREFNAGLLREFGYHVVEAIDGKDALDRFLRGKNEIDLVILDVVMPRMNGKEVYETLKKNRSDIKVLFTSGYTPDTINMKGILGENLDFIKKPHTPGELLKKVAEII
jgi:PAS domain S-box-containing protein